MRRWFRSLRLHILLPVLVMMILFTVSVTIVVSHVYIDMNLRREGKENAAFFEAFARQINEMVTSAIDDVRGITVDERITACMRNQFGTDAERIHAQIECRDYLRTQISRLGDVYGLLFIRPDGSAFGVLPYSNLFKEKRKDVPLSGQVIDQILAIPSGQTAWIGPLSGSEIYGFESSALPSLVMLAAWKTVSVQAGEGYALMLMDDSVFEEKLSLLTDEAGVIHLFSAEGREFFRMGRESGIDTETLLSPDTHDHIVRNGQMEEYGIFSMPLPGTGWTLVREVPVEEGRQSIRKIQRMVWLLAGAILLTAIWIYCLWLRRFMRSFNALKNDIIRLGQGKLEPASDPSVFIDEFESMRSELRRTGLSLNRHMETIRQMEREKLELEMNDLHNILAPHMIFNSITAIRWMASFMGAEEVSDMLIELGEVIRPVLREWRVQWMIREELEHISHYARLMDLRYANNFRLECQVPDTLLEELIPQFTLQPLIENAGQHGGQPEEPLIVSVRAIKEEDWICMTVADNGNTIQPEKVEMVREMLRTGRRDQGVGLINVYSRLVFCKGKDSTLDIGPLPEGGTVVTLRWK